MVFGILLIIPQSASLTAPLKRSLNSVDFACEIILINHNLKSPLCHPERSVNVAEGSHLLDSSTSPTATLRMTKLVVTSHSPLTHNLHYYTKPLQYEAHTAGVYSSRKIIYYLIQAILIKHTVYVAFCNNGIIAQRHLCKT